MFVLELPQLSVKVGEMTVFKDKNSQAGFLSINVCHDERVFQTQCCFSAGMLCSLHEGGAPKMPTSCLNFQVLFRALL